MFVKVLVTGATGRVGGNLIKELTEKGYEIKAFTLPSDKAEEKILKFGVELCEGDLRKSDDCARACRDIDAIIHLGAYFPQSGLDKETAERTAEEITRITFDVNVLGTFNLLEASVRYCKRCKRFVFASSEGVYPEWLPVYLPIDERHPCRPTGHMYLISKLLGEDLVLGYHRQYGLPVVICRFGSIIGAGEILDPRYNNSLYHFSHANFWLNGLRQLKEKSEEAERAIERLEKEAKDDEKLIIPYRKTDGKPLQRHLVDVRDIVQGVLLALEKKEAIGEVFNLSGPLPSDLEQLVLHMSKLLGVAYTKMVMPEDVSRFLWTGVIPYYAISSEKARYLLGYKPRYTMIDMVDSAIAFQKGEDIGVLERLQPKIPPRLSD